MFSGFTQLATDLIAGLGYVGLLIGTVLDSLGTPVATEVLVPLATILTLDGRFEAGWVFGLAVAGQTLGASGEYAIGRFGGEPFLRRYGKYILLTQRDLQRTTKVFHKYGSWLLLFGRSLPGLRGIIGYPAGVAAMPFGRFVVFTVLGSMLWTFLLMTIGYVVGDNLALMDDIAEQFALVGLAVFGLLVLWYLRRHLPRLKRKAL